jgi:RHS repeat-associated protein
MQPGLLALQPGKAVHFLGSDGRLEVNVPAGATTAADLSQAGGQLNLKITQIAPASGSNAGGSGHISFGTYLVQVVDGSGKLVPHGLRQPVTLTFHYGPGSATDVAHAFAVFNSALPGGVNLAAAPASVPTGTPASVFHLGPAQSQPTTLDSTQQTLSVTTTLSTAVTSASFNTDAPVATFGKPDPFNVDLNAGALTFSLPIDVPAGPGGLTPPLSLTYSSEGVSEQHSLQGSASWVGEGWNLSLGSISWAEHDVTTACSSCTTEWQSSWQLSDPFGTSAELIPPNINVSTYYDDTPNVYYSNGSYPNEPIRWHTATESHARIYSYVGPNSLPNMPAQVSCFRVWLANGLMEEFGCTPDSVEYYYVPSNLNSQYVAEWLLDLVTDPQGNQIHITYQNHMASLNGVSYTRDVEPKTVEWDAPACHSVQSACVPSWQPLMRVNFVASHTIARLTNSPSGCNTGSLMRCDNPLDLSGSGGTAAPEVQSTFALNDVQVQVRSSSSASWNTLKDYQFSYEASGPGQLTDPTTGKALSYAGMFDLTKLTVVGDDGSTALPTRTFSYTTLTQHYEDSAFKAVPSGNCGWSWNTNCYLWNHSRDGNSRYLSSANNGLGLAQTFSWAEARNNTHGVNSGGSTTDPLYCTSHQSGYPCNLADDENWSHAVLTSQSGSVVRPSSSGNNTVTSTTSYSYLLSHLGAQPCSDCTVGYDWGNQNDADYLDFYNGKFMGFTQVTVTNPDGSVDMHHYKATGGWGLYDTSQVTCYTSSPCHNAPWWSSATALHGREVEVDHYDTDGTTLLSKTLTQYQLTCPPSGVGGTPASSTWGTWDGNLVSMLDHNNPVAVCEIQTSQVDTYTFNGASSSLAVPHQTVSYTYDNFGNVLTVTTTSNDGGATGSPTTIVEHNDYIWNITFTANWNGVTGLHLINFLADSYTSDAGNTVHTACSYTSYDGQPYATGQQSSLTLGEATARDQYTSCGTSSNTFTLSGQLHTTTAYDQYGDQVGTTDADANAGISGHVGCTVGSSQYTTCTTYDSTWQTLPVSTGNALNQATGTAYNSSAGGGFGLWPTSTTDANGQATTTTYDPLGRPTSTTLPGETSGLTTTTTSYTAWCAGTSAQLPCLEVDTTQRLDSATTTTTRAFYDGWGNLVEIRSPGTGNQDVVQYADYDPSGRRVFLSNKYFVAAYTGGPGAAAFATPDASQPGTSTTYTNLRVTTVKDALSQPSTTTEGVACRVISGDSTCYTVATVVDPLQHQQATFTDALGRQSYIQTYTGSSSSTYAVYGTVTDTYDLAKNVVSILAPNGAKTVTTYDDAGRKTGTSDPDQGSQSFTYDPNGNLIESVDARGSAGTLFEGYDGLNRLLWRNTTNSSTGAYVTDTYDGTVPSGVPCGSLTTGANAIGHLTTELDASGPGNQFTFASCYAYDGRGQETGVYQAINTTGVTGATLLGHNDAGTLTQQIYPTGEYEQFNYSAQGWLSSITRSAYGVTNSLIPSITYTGAAGAAQLPSSYVIGGTGACSSAASAIVCANFNYDGDLRVTQATYTHPTGSTSMTDYSVGIGYDAVGNVTSVSSVLPASGGQSGGQDNQQYCYDEQNRLIWAGTSGTNPCTQQSISGTTLTSASYTATYQYDSSNRLTQSTLAGALASDPQGTYAYDSQHVDAVDAIGSTGYTAQYDAAGNMTCRSPGGAQVCNSSTQSGAHLTYDVEGRLIQWVSADGTSKVLYGYDAQGNRFLQELVTNGQLVNSHSYLGNEEVVSTPGGSPTHTVFYTLQDKRVAADQDGTWSYLLSDGIDSATVALDGSGNVIALQLYAPYGAVRSSTGTMPGSYGFGGHRADPATGLDYYGARYYDPQAGQFISADSDDGGGLNRYAYVKGNPETRQDVDGHCFPFCLITAAVGAVVGAGIAYGAQVVNNYVHHDPNPWGHVNGNVILLGAAVGGLAGLTMGASLAATGAAAGTAAVATTGEAAAAAAPAVTALPEVAGSSLLDGLDTSALAGEEAGGSGGSSLLSGLKTALFARITNPWVGALSGMFSSVGGYEIGCMSTDTCNLPSALLAAAIGASSGYLFGGWAGFLGGPLANWIRAGAGSAYNYYKKSQSPAPTPTASPTPHSTSSPPSGYSACGGCPIDPSKVTTIDEVILLAPILFGGYNVW